MTTAVGYKFQSCPEHKIEEIDGCWSVGALEQMANGNKNVSPSYGL
jgi:hypothetical protein